MKKTLLTLALTGIITLSYSGMANALDLNITKPTVKLNTQKEEAALNNKIKEMEKAQADAKAKQAAKQKEQEKKKEALKKDIEKAKADAKKKQDKNKAAAKKRQEQRINAIDNFKKSFTTVQ